ncbi:MAG: tyrosine-type recombinase/integrase [Terracidiphilus sp.]|nr:tyrosine-type recombinase/integrase [Terracidiphilus sp.]
MAQFALSIVGGFAKQSSQLTDKEEPALSHQTTRPGLLSLQMDSGFSSLPFSNAAKLWMELRSNRSHLKPRTHETNGRYIDTLNKFFGAKRLSDITADDVYSYQLARSANTVQLAGGRESHPWTHKAGHSMINHELSCLGQILEHCNLWRTLKPYYFPLSIPAWSPRDVLSEEDEQHLFTVASNHPEAHLAYWVACITNNTTAAGCELRGLQLKHIFLRGPEDISEIYVPEEAVKNNSRPRKIALNPTARWAVEQCYKRAFVLGCSAPDHYLFPFCARRSPRDPELDPSSKRPLYDPTRPPSRWFLRKSWDKLRQVTGFTQLNPHDLRHHCITRMLERGVQPEAVRAVAGHVTEKMMRYYSHFRRQAVYEAVMAIELNYKGRPKQLPVPVKRAV